MSASRVWKSFSTFLVFSRLVLAQGNQITNFCRRFAHQTAWIDNRLYIDGGYVDVGNSISNSTVNQTNTQLLWADTSHVNANHVPQLYANLSKPANVPSVAGGALWPDTVNKLFYLFGGEYNATSSPPASAQLWFYDTIYHTWNTTSTNLAASGISPSAFGASVVDENGGNAYYYGGWQSNATEAGYVGDKKLHSGFVQYDLSTGQWLQSSFIDDTPRGEGQLFYIPVSTAGMLVYIGGVEQKNESANGSAGTTGMPMNTIHLFDIGSQRSYSQNTTGTAPAMRRKFCGGVSWPEDRSSFNIYIYGGLPPYEQEGVGFADGWILSLPSFNWIPLFNSTDSPHHSMSCNVIDNGQMIVMGGAFPDSSNNACDQPAAWGMQNLNLGSQTTQDSPWSPFDPNITTYSVPPNLTAVIGGSPTGGATVSSPPHGFTESQLGACLWLLAPLGERTATRAIPTATSIPTHHSGGGSTKLNIILGSVLGSLALLGLTFGLVLFCLKRRKQKFAHQRITSYPPPPRYTPCEEFKGQLMFTKNGHLVAQLSIPSDDSLSEVKPPVPLSATKSHPPSPPSPHLPPPGLLSAKKYNAPSSSSRPYYQASPMPRPNPTDVGGLMRDKPTVFVMSPSGHMLSPIDGIMELPAERSPAAIDARFPRRMGGPVHMKEVLARAMSNASSVYSRPP